jgi:SNF2 family DNA or RNA helicase
MPRDRYFPNWQPIKDADKKIRELIAPVSQFVDKATCLTLPPLVKKVIEVEMSNEQLRLYKEMRDSLVATINTPTGDKHSVADLAITKALRLQQIASGYLSTTNEKGEVVTVKIKDNPRKEALRQLLEDIVPFHKVLIWAVFHDNYDDIRDVCYNLNVEFSELHGLVKDKDAEAHRFRTDPKCRVLIGHPGSGGIGVNLIEASYMIYYSRNFSLEFDIQSEARNMRGGSEMHEKITRIDLIASNTIDQLVATSLANKIQISDSVLKQKIGEL